MKYFVAPHVGPMNAPEAHALYSKMWDEWMRAVDRLLINLCGLDSGSLEDWHWFDAFDAELSPQEAVDEWREEVLRNYGVGSHD
jgi:hypothetical protein